MNVFVAQLQDLDSSCIDLLAPSVRLTLSLQLIHEKDKDRVDKSIPKEHF